MTLFPGEQSLWSEVHHGLMPMWKHKLCRKKDVASRKALRTKDQLHINKLKSLRRDVKKLIRTEYNAYIKKLADLEFLQL